ncbi:YidH family protein [Gordonia iterans]
MKRAGEVTASPQSGRWPRSVFDLGDEPDPRFTFANQRTLLAWVRTGLAYVLAGAVVDLAPVPLPALARGPLALLLSIAGVVCVVHGWRSWRTSEIAMRHDQPLPSSAAPSLYLLVSVTTAALIVSALAMSKI